MGIDVEFVVDNRRLVGGKRTSFGTDGACMAGANFTGKCSVPGGICAATDDDDTIVEVDDVRPGNGTTDAVPV